MPTPSPPAVAVAADIDPVLSLVIGALGAAILTALAGLLGAWLNSLREHAKWVREQRVDAYRAFLKATELTWPSQSKEQTVWGTYMDDMGTALGVVQMVGPDEPYQTAMRHLNAMLDVGAFQRKVNGLGEDGMKHPELVPSYQAAAVKSHGTREAFVVATRKVLGIRD